MTPKTLDKYIAALKKKAAAENWDKAKYEAELDSMHADMVKQFLAGKITGEEFAKVTKQFENAKNSPSLQKKKTAQTDPGAQAADAAVAKLEKELKQVYGRAVKEMKDALKELQDSYGPLLGEKHQLLTEGKTSKAEYEAWIKGQMMQQDIVKQKIDQLSGTMYNANKKAMAMISGEQVNVFAENANWQSYQLDQHAGVNLMFSVYDEDTAKKLLKDKPELLPRKVVNGKKDKAWNQKIIANEVLQSVIQGESIPDLAARIAAQTGETNMKAMIRYARTAMTSAQNSGRMEMLHRAKDMGIKVRKKWLATLDNRTRDAHAKLDGQVKDVDEPFQSAFGEIMFPGDVNSKGSIPANLYNCRCALVYVYDDFPADPTKDKRLDNETKQPVMNMNYDEWKAATEGGKLNDLNLAKALLAEAQKAVVNAKIKEDKVYDGIWKDPVTLADYAGKKGSIQAKRDYYDAEIQKYKDAQANGASWATDAKIKELEKKKKLLNEFEKKGQLIEKRDSALAEVQNIYGQVGIGKQASVPAVAKKATAAKGTKTAQKAASVPGGTNTGAASQNAAGLSLGAAGAQKTPFDPDAYSQERKDKALWTRSKDKVDAAMRGRTGEVWNAATQEERRGIYEYTSSFSKFNEPLRGIEYGTNRFLGVGNTDLNAGSRRNGPLLNAMTDIIEKCSYDHDMWLQRGCGWKGMDKFFQVSDRLLRYGTQQELEQALLGKTVTEYGFMSMGSAKGQGFSGSVILNVYAPAGTKMMYAEPFSAYSGGYDHLNWDGKSKQTHYGHEFETIMQQGTQFRISKVERSSSHLFVDLEVINQDNQQRWKK